MFEKLEVFAMAQALARHGAARQAVIAQNVANADTPGYRARDAVEFSETYRTTRDGGLRASRPAHALGAEPTPYAAEIRDLLAAEGLRVEVDDRSESLKKKIREAQLAKTPLILTCGAKEQETGNLAVRTLDGQVHYGVPMERFKEIVKDHVAARKLDLPAFGD